MTTSDWIAALALFVSLLAFADSRRTGRLTKRQYAAERREETLASAKILRDTLSVRTRELELLLSDLEFRAPSGQIIQVNSMIEETNGARASLDRTIAKMQDDRSLDLHDFVIWFNMKREILDIELNDKRLTEKIRAFRSAVLTRKSQPTDKY